MNYRKLGKTNFQVSDIGYGAWGIGGKQWLGGQDDESLKALRLAIERGVNLIDTALAYGDGHSEQLVHSHLSLPSCPDLGRFSLSCRRKGDKRPAAVQLVSAAAAAHAGSSP